MPKPRTSKPWMPKHRPRSRASPPPARWRTLSSDRAWVSSPIRRPSLLRPIEVGQVRRLLVFLGGHQTAVRALEIHVVADEDQPAALHAHVLGPDRIFGLIAAVLFCHRPWPRQRMVD